MIASPSSRPALAPLVFGGATLSADPSGALVWPEQRTIVIADLHLEKGSSFAAKGVLLPPYDTGATLDRLEEVIAAHQSERVICLGDSFHDAAAGDRLAPCETGRLGRLTRAHEWIWIAGNHDPHLVAGLGGRIVAEELRLGPLVFRHIAAGGPVAGEVSGHYHPKASLVWRGRRLSGRCFLSDGRRLVLPAFGAYAGGLDARAAAFAPLFPSGFDTHLIARDRITTLPRGWFRSRAG